MGKAIASLERIWEKATQEKSSTFCSRPGGRRFYSKLKSILRKEVSCRREASLARSVLCGAFSNDPFTFATANGDPSWVKGRISEPRRCLSQCLFILADETFRPGALSAGGAAHSIGGF